MQELRKMNFTKSVLAVVMLAVLMASLPIHSIFDFFPNTSIGFIVEEDLTEASEDSSNGNCEDADEQDLLFSQCASLFNYRPTGEASLILLNVPNIPHPFFDKIAPPPKG